MIKSQKIYSCYCTKENASFPQLIRKYVKYYGKKQQSLFFSDQTLTQINESNQDILDDCHEGDCIGITIEPHKLIEKILPQLLDVYTIDDEKNKFITELMKSKYLSVDDENFNNQDSEYTLDFY
jgi:uncharacterized membrane protein YheB (UPF0754 family)